MQEGCTLVGSTQTLFGAPPFCDGRRFTVLREAPEFSEACRPGAARAVLHRGSVDSGRHTSVTHRPSAMSQMASEQTYSLMLLLCHFIRSDKDTHLIKPFLILSRKCSPFQFKIKIAVNYLYCCQSFTLCN